MQLDDVDDDAFNSEDSCVTNESWRKQLTSQQHSNKKTCKETSSDREAGEPFLLKAERDSTTDVQDSDTKRATRNASESRNDLSKASSQLRKKATAAPRHRRRSDNRSSQSDDVTSTERKTTKRKRQHNHRSRHEKSSRASSDRSRRRHSDKPHNPAHLTPPPRPFDCDSEGRSRSPQVSPFQKVKEWMLAPHVTPEPPDDLLDANLELKTLATSLADVSSEGRVNQAFEESAA